MKKNYIIPEIEVIEVDLEYPMCLSETLHKERKLPAEAAESPWLETFAETY